jgi:hypothetical protein
VTIPDPFEDLVPINPQPMAQSAFTPAPSQQFSFDKPRSSFQGKWLWIGIGVFVLLLIGCYVCQNVVNLQSLWGYYY